MFYRLDAAYNLALLSIDELKEERLNDALGYYNAFIKAYPSSEFMDEAHRMKDEIQQELNTITTKS